MRFNDVYNITYVMCLRDIFGSPINCMMFYGWLYASLHRFIGRLNIKHTQHQHSIGICLEVRSVEEQADINMHWKYTITAQVIKLSMI